MIALVFLVYLKKTTDKPSRANIDLISLFILIFIAAFSFHNGWDSYNYLGYFISVNEGGWSVVVKYSLFGLEFGYLTYLYLMSLVTDEYQVVVFIQSIILNLIMFVAIRRVRIDYTLFALLFFSSFFIKFELSTIRQGIAVAIVTLSYKHIIEHNFKRFSLTIIVAMLFHYSAAAMFVFYIFNKLKINKKRAIQIGAFAIPAFFITVVFKDVANNVLVNSIFAQLPVTNKLIAYFSKNNNISLPIVQLYSLGLYLFFCFFLYKPKDNRSQLTLSLFSFLILLQFYAKMFPSLLLVRLEYYFILSQLFVWVLLFERIYSKKKVMNVVLLLTLIPILNFSIALRNQYDRQAYLPYYSYIEYILFDTMPRTQKDLDKLSASYK